MAKTYFGKVCTKHPESKGERYSSNRACLACEKERQRKYNEENREAKSACNRKYHEENREALLARMRKYREENRETVLARLRKYNEENRDALLAYWRKYDEENREAKSARIRKWREEFKAKHGISYTTHCSRLKKQKEAQQCSV